jgi:hypothetical protein
MTAHTFLLQDRERIGILRGDQEIRREGRREKHGDDWAGEEHPVKETAQLSHGQLA